MPDGRELQMLLQMLLREYSELQMLLQILLLCYSPEGECDARTFICWREDVHLNHVALERIVLSPIHTTIHVAVT
jgi:hypothetical protein